MSLSQWDASCSIILSSLVIFEFLNKTKVGSLSVFLWGSISLTFPNKS